MSVWRRDAESLTASLYNYERQMERRSDAIHTQYRATIVRIISDYLARGDLNGQMPIAEFMEHFRLIQPRLLRLVRYNSTTNRVIQRLMRQVSQTRLEALIAEITLEMIELNIELERNIHTTLSEGYSRAYYHSSYNIARRTGIGINVPRLNEHFINSELSENWSGQIWQERQWNNNQTILGYMLGAMDQALHYSMTARHIIGMVMERFEFSRWQTTRILRTEFGHFVNNALEQSYELNDIQLYEYIATLDCLTCGDCGNLDGQIFRLSNRQAGVNAPVLHPHCRCTTSPTFLDELESDWRRARLENGANTIIDGNITFNQWVNEFVR